jgi:hypothetical protein
MHPARWQHRHAFASRQRPAPKRRRHAHTKALRAIAQLRRNTQIIHRSPVTVSFIHASVSLTDTR